MDSQVDIWMEDIIIPTYLVGEPEKNPMFLEKRVYQGSSGVVYPHPVIEKIYDKKIDKKYNGVFLENEYIKMMVLPELGGRIQMAYDKVKQRHFIYYNQVIKPALVGLTGPWISGGIEFNWPQHHRPSTFEPIDFTLHENADGSKTIWVNEVERMFRTKGMIGFTLQPGKAYIQVSGKLYNRTPFPQTFLWWANPAVKVNDHYQSVFPPDVYAVFDHGKRDVSSFPVAKGVYYNVDYAPGTDISRYKNIPVPTSFMAVNSKYNFIGGYEHDTRGGLLHVADHQVAPGKKQWTWGNGEFGKAWDKNLTDEDGPYAELMTGVFTDNQPDFSWIQPYESKEFDQYFMPYSEVGIVKNATKEAIVSLDIFENSADIKLYLTGSYNQIKVSLINNNKEIFTDIISGCPHKPYLNSVELASGTSPEDLLLKITDIETSKLLVSYQPEVFTRQEIPSPAKPAKQPAEVENNEQLYLTGHHIEQYRHAIYNATDYYEEALRRDAKDIRCNNAMGLWFLRRGKFLQAEAYFNKAIDTATQRNPNPYNGEIYYNLGWSLKLQQRPDEAFEAFYKSIWNDAWQHAGFLNLSRIAAEKNNYEQALDFINKSLVKNYHSHTARHLKVLLLRKLNKSDEAKYLIEESISIDPFNFGCLFESYIISNNAAEKENIKHKLKTLSRNWSHNFIEYSFDYAHAGLYDEAIQLLEIHRSSSDEIYPMINYYLGWFCYKQNQFHQALQYFSSALSLSPDFCFPNRIEDVHVLQKAIEVNNKDFKACYYLGNFWYDKRQYKDAIEIWEQSVSVNDQFPTVHRNLSLAYYNKCGDVKKALKSLQTAFTLDPTDARVLMELDQLYKKINTPPATRLTFLEKHLDLVQSRDDLFLERITLYNYLEQYSKAKELILSYHFHPWEGGEGKVTGEYVKCNIGLANNAIESGCYKEALQLLEDAENYPFNLGEGKLYTAQENDIFYLKGLAFERLDNKDKAIQYFKKATAGISEPIQAIFYNDPQPDKIFYQGLAWYKLQNKKVAQDIFKKLISFGNQHLQDNITIDYFAVSLPDMLVFDADLNLLNKIHCLYLMGLGCLGLNKLEKANKYFDKTLKLDINHYGAAIHKKMVTHLSTVKQ